MPITSDGHATGVLASFATRDILLELVRRGGVVAQVAAAQLLVEKKSEDYNQQGGAATNALTADRDAYFPFGAASYVQMIHVKSQRLVSLVHKTRSGDGANFEGMIDTAKDLVNYAAFLAERLDRDGDVL